MHVLCRLRHVEARQCLPQLRRRTGSSAQTSRKQARQISRINRAGLQAVGVRRVVFCSVSARRHRNPRSFANLGKHRFNRHPGEGRGPRPWQVIEHAAGVDTGRLSPRCRPGRYGGKFELFRVFLGTVVTRCESRALRRGFGRWRDMKTLSLRSVWRHLASP